MEVDGTIPSRRYGHSMVVHNRCFYVYGGYDDFGYKCNDMYEFRPMSNKWNKVKTAGEAPERYHHSAVSHGGSMYLFGGSCTDMSLSSALFEYRFGTATWTRVPTHQRAPEPRWGHSSFIHDNQLYILGGCDNILCFKEVYRISLDSLDWKRVKKISGFDPRYFGGCVLLHSNWAKCEYSPPFVNQSSSISEDHMDAASSSSSDHSDTSSSSNASSSGATVLHHSHAVTAALSASRGGHNTTTTTTNTATAAPTLTVPSIAPPPLNGTRQASSTASSSSSTTGTANSGATSPPLPSVIPLSPLPASESIGSGFKVLYIGGRNIHNWAFSDVLVLSLEGEDAYDPFQMQMQILVGNAQHSDVAFTFPNEVQSPAIPAHKAILAIRCEPFAKMLSLGMAESSTGIIEISDVPSHLFRVFLSFIYTGSLPALDALQDNLHMLYLSDKYFLAHLKSLCESRIKTFISSSTVPTIWESASATHAPSLQRACVRFVTRYSDVLMTSAGKKSLPKSLVVEAKAKLQQLSASSN